LYAADIDGGVFVSNERQRARVPRHLEALVALDVDKRHWSARSQDFG
jgi:hypothetical protein